MQFIFNKNLSWPRESNPILRSDKILNQILYDRTRSYEKSYGKSWFLKSWGTSYYKILSRSCYLIRYCTKILQNRKIFQISYTMTYCKISGTTIFCTISYDHRRPYVWLFHLGSLIKPRSKNLTTDRTRPCKILHIQDFLSDLMIKSDHILLVHFFKDFVRFWMKDGSVNLTRSGG